MEKIEVRSDEDGVLLSVLMPEWFCSLEEDKKLDIVKALKQYANMFQMMLGSEKNMQAFTLILAKGMLAAIGEYLGAELKK